MSVKIPLTQLSPMLQKRIASECTLKIINRIGNQFTDQEKCLALMVEDGYVYIPYYTASIVLEKPFPNQGRRYLKIEPFSMADGFSLREYQEEVIKEAMRQYHERGTCFFNVFCAFGKTVVAVYVAHIFSQAGYRTLITFPTDLIRKSWLGTVQSRTKAKFFLYDGKSDPPADAQIILSMYSQLANMPKDLRRTIGHLVVDEAHLFCTESRIQALLGFQPMYITLLTATYEKDNGLHLIMDRLVGPEKITKISSKPFFVWKFMTHISPDPDKITHTMHGVNYGSIIKALDQDPRRNELIVNLIKANPNEKIMVLVEHVEQANQLYALVKEAVKSQNRLVSKLTGKEKTYYDAHILVATSKKAGTGFDEQESCENWGGVRFNMLILCNPGMKIEQNAGRVGRSELPVIIDLVDDHPNLKRHFTERKHWYEDRNGIIIKTDKIFCWADEFPKRRNEYLNKQSKVEDPDRNQNPYATYCAHYYDGGS